MPDEWQARVLQGWLGRKWDGKWSAPQVGLAVPRQNGKNGILEVRELYGMVLLGEKFLHTAHEVKTARKAFMRLLHFFDNPRKFPELNDLVREIRRTNGQEAIFLDNGGSIEFIARSKGSGRGFTVDVLVCDEAQELSDDTNAALLPTISAAPLGNPQKILTGTPPAPSMNGEVFTRMRKAGIEGKNKRLCWDEWSCAPGADINSRASWALANPAIGKRLSYETTEDERAAMDDETFGRERCGIWDEEDNATDQALDLAGWKATVDPDTKLEQVAAFGIAVSFDRSVTAIGVAGLREDEKPHLEVVEHRRGNAWVVDRCVELAAESYGAVFVIDGGGPSRNLIEPLERAGVNVEAISASDVGSACAWLADAVKDRAVFHGPQTELDAAVIGAKRRNIGDGIVGFAFARRNSAVDISPLEAVALAAHILPSVIPLDDVTITFI